MLMIAIQTLAKMVAPALTVSIHIYVRVPWDLVEATVKTVSKISSIVVSSFVQLWYSKILVTLRIPNMNTNTNTNVKVYSKSAQRDQA